MTEQKEKDLSLFAANMRRAIIEEIYHAKSGHPGGSLSAADVIAYLYKCEMKHNPAAPHDPARDRFVLSKGHAAPALYAALALCGYFDPSELVRLRKYDSFLQGHPDMKGTPGVDMSTGSLGQGVSAACGMALAGKLSGDGYRVYALLGDGELNEGEVWEAAMFAAHYKLSNLCAVIDLNGLQIDGRTGDVMDSAPVDEKFRAFGWNVVTASAHSFAELEKAFAAARAETGKPTAIIAASVKGRGVSFMEDSVGWHGVAPKDDDYEKATAELDLAVANIRTECRNG